MSIYGGKGKRGTPRSVWEIIKPYLPGKDRNHDPNGLEGKGKRKKGVGYKDNLRSNHPRPKLKGNGRISVMASNSVRK